jgi:hypothetical protein
VLTVVCVCVCVRERERDCICLCVWVWVGDWVGVCACACACVCVGVSQTGILCTSDEVLVVLLFLYLNRNTVETFANGWQVVFTDSGLKFT